MAETNSRKDKSVELVNDLILVSGFFQKTGNRQITGFGLNQPQFAVLREIVMNKDISQKDILGEFLLEKSNLSKIIKKLEQMALIEISVPETDRRKTVLNATEKGIKIFSDCMNDLNKLKELFTQPLKDKELENLIPAVKQLKDLVLFHIKNNKEN